MNRYALGVFALCIFMTTGVLAHSGGLNSQGCHAGSRPYHCHRSSTEMVKSSNGGYRLKCSEGSQSKDCTSQTSLASSSTVKAVKKSLNTYDIQVMLLRHCPQLPQKFADGLPGKKTVSALKEFQLAYGLTVDGIYGPATIDALQGPVNGLCQAK